MKWAALGRLSGLEADVFANYENIAGCSPAWLLGCEAAVVWPPRRLACLAYLARLACLAASVPRCLAASMTR